MLFFRVIINFYIFSQSSFHLSILKNKSYRLSWDDKYLELCKEQNMPVYNEVTFDKEMPEIK